jgi:recombination protein RecT
MSALEIISGEIGNARDGFMSVLTDTSINFEREAKFALQAISKNDFTIGVALKNKGSVINAVTNIAAIGISLNPAKKQAYLVPRNGEICLDISYMGLMDLAMATGSIKWAQAEIVYENDGFAKNGFDKPPTHTYNPFGGDRGAIVGVYVVVKTADGDYLTHTMSIADAYAIRNRSEAWKRKESGPWKTDETEMIKKTCVKQAYKYWPKTERLEKAIHYLNTDGGEGIVMQDNQPAESKVDVAPLIADALKTKTDAEALAFWKSNNGLLAKQPSDHKRLKDALAAHRARLFAEKAAAEDVTDISGDGTDTIDSTIPPGPEDE